MRVIGFDDSEVFSEVCWSDKNVAYDRERVRERKRNDIVAVGFYRWFRRFDPTTKAVTQKKEKDAVLLPTVMFLFFQEMEQHFQGNKERTSSIHIEDFFSLFIKLPI